MNFKAVLQLSLVIFFAVFALPLTAKEAFYGNPSETCPAPFRMYTMVDYLYWQASEGGLEYSLRRQSIEAIDFPYKNGFRLGGGLVFPYYDWQLEIDWTRFYHTLRDFRTDSSYSLFALWMHPENHGYLTWSGASFGWELKFDTIDFDLLRVGFASKHFSLTPRIGLKRAWIAQNGHIRYEHALDPTLGMLAQGFYDVRFNNDFRGIGPRIGFDTQLLTKWGFGLISSGAVSLLYGHVNSHRIDVSSQWANINVFEKVYRFKPTVQTLIALQWLHCFCKEQSFRVLVSLGYEGQLWWSQNQQRSFVSGSLPPSSFKPGCALTLQGLDFHARFDF